MLLWFSILSVIIVASATKPSCDPKTLGASVEKVLSLASLPGCICVSSQGCERGKLHVTPESFKYDGSRLGTWVGKRTDDHWRIVEPFLASGHDLIPIKEKNNIVLVLCDRNKVFREALVDFTEKPTDEELNDLRERYDIEIGVHITSCGFH